MTDRYASENGRVAPLSPGEVLFHNLHAGTSHVMTLQVLSALDRCRTFKTMDEHVQTIMAQVEGLQGQPEAVLHVLNAMAERKLMVKASDVVEEFRRPANRELQPFAGIFVRTCDRPAQLENLLATLPAEDPRVCVLDDSRGSEATAKNQELVAAAVDRGVRAQYLGMEQRAEMTEALVADTGAPVAQVRHLLSDREDAARFSGGRVLNFALLLSAGRRLILLDDDFRWDPRRYGPDDAALELRPAQPRVAFYDTYGAAQASGRDVGSAAIADVIDVCGKTLGDLLTDDDVVSPRTEDWAGTALATLRELSADTRIVSVLPASYGDDRTGHREWLYSLEADGRRSLWGESREDYQRHLENRHITYTMAQPTLRGMANFTPLAMDNASLLPPAAPLYRGEDLYQSALTRYCYPRSACLEVPLALGHWREGKRRLDPPTARTPGISRYIADAVLGNAVACEAHEPDARLAYASATLRDMAGASNARRQERLRQYLTSVRADTVNQLNRILEEVKQAPDYWITDVRTLVEVNALALTEGGLPRLADWRTEASPEACADRLAADLRRHADALDVWPALWRACEGRLDEWLR